MGDKQVRRCAQDDYGITPRNPLSLRRSKPYYGGTSSPPGIFVLPVRLFARIATLGVALIAPLTLAAQGKPASSATAPATGKWRALISATSAPWRGYKEKGMPAGWTVKDGVLSKEKPVGDIISNEQFGDFELEIEWRISSGGNSGIFYRGTEDEEKIYWTAPEYQLLDDEKAEDNKTRLTCAGAAYGLYPSPAGHLKPVGEWNATRIIAKGAHVEHWVNGFKLLEYELWSPDWEAKVKASKFVEWKKYGRAKSGHLALQGDHDGALAFRKIRIRELK